MQFADNLILKTAFLFLINGIIFLSCLFAFSNSKLRKYALRMNKKIVCWLHCAIIFYGKIAVEVKQHLDNGNGVNIVNKQL